MYHTLRDSYVENRESYRRGWFRIWCNSGPTFDLCDSHMLHKSIEMQLHPLLHLPWRVDDCFAVDKSHTRTEAECVQKYLMFAVRFPVRFAAGSVLHLVVEYCGKCRLLHTGTHTVLHCMYHSLFGRARLESGSECLSPVSYRTLRCVMVSHSGSGLRGTSTPRDNAMLMLCIYDRL